MTNAIDVGQLDDLIFRATRRRQDLCWKLGAVHTQVHDSSQQIHGIPEETKDAG